MGHTFEKIPLTKSSAALKEFFLKCHKVEDQQYVDSTSESDTCSDKSRSDRGLPMKRFLDSLDDNTSSDATWSNDGDELVVAANEEGKVWRGGRAFRTFFTYLFLFLCAEVEDIKQIQRRRAQHAAGVHQVW